MPEAEHAPPPRVVRRRGGTPIAVKLWSLTILVNLAGFLVAIWVARLVRAVPDSQGTETALLFGYYAAMFVVAFFDALLLDELAFKGAFRRTHLEGRAGRFAGRSDDVESVAVSMQRTTVSFPVLMLIGGAVTYLLFNAVNRDFDTYYRRVGKPISALEHADEPGQIEAIVQLSIRREREIVPALRRRLEGDGPPAAWAAWALGRFGDLPTRRPLLPPLVEAARRGDPALRREALVALGRLQHRPMAEPIHAEIRAQMDAGEPIDLRLLYALGSIQVMSSVPLLEEILHRSEVPAQRMAAWALAQHRDQRGGREVVTILEDRLATAPFEVRCAIVHALGILADERSNLAIVRSYDATPLTERTATCPRLELSLRPDGQPDDRQDLFMPQDTFVVKVLMSMGQMRATTAEVRAVVEPWLEGLISDPSTTPATQEAAASLLTGIRQGRDDTQGPTVEEALGIASK